MIEVDRVTVQRGASQLLTAISLQISPGRLTAILGPNGAGKSTLLRALAGEIAPTSGAVSLLGRPVTRWSAAELAQRRAVVPQHASLAFSFSVEEVVALGRAMWDSSEESRRTAHRALTLVGLRQWARRDYLTLSGGERQRVHLARALAQLWNVRSDHPVALLLDEPTASLDLRHQQRAMELAESWARRGAAVVAIVHDINLAAAFADDAVLLQEGRLLAAGPVADTLTPALLSELYGLPVHLFLSGTAALLAPSFSRTGASQETGPRPSKQFSDRSSAPPHNGSESGAPAQG